MKCPTLEHTLVPRADLYQGPAMNQCDLWEGSKEQVDKQAHRDDYVSIKSTILQLLACPGRKTPAHCSARRVYGHAVHD